MKRIIRWVSTFGLVMAISVVAVSVAFAQSFTGTFDASSQQSVYYLQVQANTDIAVNVICTSNQDLDTFVMVKDSNGVTVDFNDDDALAGCSGGLGSRFSENGLAAGTYSVLITTYNSFFGLAYNPAFNAGDWQLDVNCNPACVTVSGPAGSPNGSDKLDNRINQDAVSGPVALYCTGSLLDVYGVNSEGKGYFAFRAATNVPIPAETELVKSFENIALYHLASGEWQVNAGPDAEGKTYVFLFYGCPYFGDGTSWTETGNQ